MDSKFKRLRSDGQLLNQDRQRTQASAEALTDANYRDQFYTKHQVMKDIIEKCRDIIKPNMTFVDFSCGTNEFAQLLLPLCSATISYDISPTIEAVRSGASTQNWFDVQSIPDNSIVGLNPPFGYRGNLAKQFLTHAASLGPRYILAIIPIMEWSHSNYVEVRSIKLPLAAFYIPSTLEDFEYPTFFRLFERTSRRNQTALKSHEQITSLTGVTAICHASAVQYSYPAAMVIRRVGFYTGRQAYVVKNKRIVYVHKHEVQEGVTWMSNKHAIDNAFWVVYFDHDLSIEELIALVQGIRNQVDKESLTTREEDVKRAPSLKRGDLLRLIRDNWPERLRHVLVENVL